MAKNKKDKITDNIIVSNKDDIDFKSDDFYSNEFYSNKTKKDEIKKVVKKKIKEKKAEKKAVKVETANISNLNIYVYLGTLKRFSFKNIFFDYGVPTYIPLQNLKDVQQCDQFVPYEPGKHTIQGTRKILVNLPGKIDNFLASLNTLYRIKECYPMTSVVVRCRFDLFKLLKGVEHCNSVSPQTEYLKEIDLFDNKIDGYKTATNLKMHNLNELILRQSGYFVIGQDEKIKPVEINQRKDVPFVTLIHNQKLKETWVESAHTGESTKSDEIIKYILCASKYVSFGDYDHNHLACALGIPSIIFVNNAEESKKYKVYKNCTCYLMPVNEQHEEDAKNKIGALFNGC